MAEGLRGRIIGDGEVVGNGLVRLTRFFNHQVDMRVVGQAGRGLSAHLQGLGVTKIVTAPVSGLLCAIPLSEALGVDFVYTRSTIPKTFAGQRIATVQEESRTKGSLETYSVMASAFSSTDRVVIADDFLASGRTMAALADLVAATGSGAKVVAFVALVEKPFQGGRARVAERHPHIPVFTSVSILDVEGALSRDNVLCSSNVQEASAQPRVAKL